VANLTGVVGKNALVRKIKIHERSLKGEIWY
jgi:hypothetical protein